MTERGLPSLDGSPACPFVAFEDDRDERAASPDHRHRCFAEAEPAPRALAHQEAYCLSSAFPVCPTFQEWARREAAHARLERAATPVASTDEALDGAEVEVSADGERANGDPLEPARDEPADAWAGPAAEVPPIESTPRRNPPRDWAAPPPWATGSGSGASGASAADGDTGTSAAFVVRRSAGQGLAGSAADRLAAGEQVAFTPSIDPAAGSTGARSSAPRSAAPDPELAGLVGAAAVTGELGPQAAPAATPRRAAGTPRRAGRDHRRDRDRAATPGHFGPSWEEAPKYEAYPTIKTGPGLAGVALPRVALFAGALALAALGVFFLPALFVGGDGARPSPTPSAAVVTPSPEPTAVPAPTPRIYVIKSGDTLSKIARRFDITLDALLAANKDTIKDADKIKVGDEIIIPPKGSAGGDGDEPEASGG
jgi:LysM repeat protein